MRHPLQALLIAPNPIVRADIHNGKKAITIREGHRDYREGPVMLCCHLDPWAVQADITEIRHTTLGEITEAEFTDDGYETREQMLEDLRSFYADIDFESPVTVIRWANVRGAWIDAKHIYARDYALPYLEAQEAAEGGRDKR